jgi:signal transduction histidine kinase
MQAVKMAEATGKLDDGQRVQFLSVTFRRVHLVVFLLFIFAVVQMFTLWQVCKTGMQTAASLKQQGLPTLNELALLQEHLALYRLDSYEYLFAQQGEKAGRAKAAEDIAVQMRAELKNIQTLLPEGEGRQLAANLEKVVNDLDVQFQKVRSLVDPDFPAAMKSMDQDIPPRVQQVDAAANALRQFGYQFSGGQASATFASFGWIKSTAVMFGAANSLVVFCAFLFVLLAARRSRAQLAETLARLDERTREVEKTHAQLLLASRQAGMAEIATNVLHNVGNVLNSVNISASVVVESVKKSKVSSLAKVVVLLQEHEHDLGTFITSDPKGRQLPAYLAQLSDHFREQHLATVKELDLLRGNIDHIKEIVAMQQSYAKVSGVKEIVNLNDLVEDSLRMNEGALNRHKVQVIREFETVGPMNVEKHKILQILVNLIRNAKHACQDSKRVDKQLTVRVANGAGCVRISVADNGVGVPPENLTRIFNHGFTTKKDGHGFGLHSGALAAKVMGGSLTVHSNGSGLGAMFTLELPLESESRAK